MGLKPRFIVLCAESYAVLTSRKDIIYIHKEILACLLRKSSASLIIFLWVPAHVGVEVIEMVDKALKCSEIDIQVTLSKEDVKSN